MNVSVLILTYNEEVNIQGCLDSLQFCDDIVILDSESTDSTLKIAQDAGATILTRPFDNYAAQRNFGLSHDFKHDWILMLDADERVDDMFVEEMASLTRLTNNPVTLYRMRRKDMFMGKWIKRSSGYPTWFGRLFKKGCVRVEREINEEYYTDGEIGLMKEHLIHYPFNKGIDYWFERHNRYSSMEAVKLAAEQQSKIRWKDFLNHDPMLRRKAFKALAYRMPMRPALTFCFLYFVKMGFLDGRAGFHFSLMRSIYEYMISLKMKEGRIS
ncbi:Glycosyltransferase involved in cell wall bisynthesis [Rubritalea squalenifaciens DSM 18772]|uniref:Glycosyltransferase involved in cell wall bisynthesis n=1 Tax=Rubritalea squalenifaciens DSM 18772 TaxID=1123071 RepID=A0A1M6QYK7_9BACT|nr:glycosyltransferase family 2 protein [Rubritalea squalenifaciens]SHK25243.1 Glycosyltransferase involved in cell wall bisynthesis [Rubritalea squalenifaciens DSM 18772]